MSPLFRVLALAALAPCFAAAAAAADLDPVYIPQEPVPLPAASGWYLRADIGYAFETETNGYYYGFDAALAPNYPRFHYEELRLGGAAEFGVGVGYQFNDYFRSDVTLAYWQRNVSGRARSPYNCLGIDPLDASCRFEDSSKLSAWELMVNAYVDVAHYGRFTPYLGGGVGLAHLKHGGLTNNAFCVDATGNDVPGCGYVGRHGGVSSTRFAWALMAGTAIDITERVKIDLGYRYSRIEGGDAFGWDEDDTAAGAAGTQTFDNGYSSHHLRAGLRVALW